MQLFEHDALLQHPWVLLTHAPVYVMRFPADPDNDTLDALCAARERWAKFAAHPCAWVADMSQLRAMPSAHQRRVFADHLTRFAPHDVAWNHGSAIVAPNPIVKGALTAVFWMAPPKFPNQVFSSFDDALAWATARLAGRSDARVAR
jgi:hypothetical protein